MDGVDPERLGKDMLPRVRESNDVLTARTLNWTVAPCPTPGWAALVHPELEPDAALERLWSDIAHVCRLDEPDPVAAWNVRLDHLLGVAAKLERARLDSLRFDGPGHRPDRRPAAGQPLERGAPVDRRRDRARSEPPDRGGVHDPRPGADRRRRQLDQAAVRLGRADHRAARAVRRRPGGADRRSQGAGTLRALAARDPGACRLGEVALVDRESRIGQLDTVFYDTLLDENAASHIALGEGLDFAVDGEDSLARLNHSEIHIDFMIGSNEVAVTGVAADGTEFPLLRDGAWQI